MKLNYKIIGDESNEKILVLHGLFGALDNWQNVCKLGFAEYCCIIVDHRNHGASPHSATHTYEEMVGDLIELLNDMGIEKIHVMGHSMGGKTAMLLTNNFPERVKKLIIGDIAPVKYPSRFEEQIEAMEKVNLEVSSRSDIDKGLAKYIKDASVRQLLLKNIKRNPDGSFDWKLNIPVMKRCLPFVFSRPAVEKIEKNTLFLKGAHSNYITEAGKKEIKKVFTKVDIQEVSNAGHWVHVDNTSEYCQKAKKFLKL